MTGHGAAYNQVVLSYNLGRNHGFGLGKMPLKVDLYVAVNFYVGLWVRNSMCTYRPSFSLETSRNIVG